MAQVRKIRLLQNFHTPLKQIRSSFSKNSAEEFLKRKLIGLKEEALALRSTSKEPRSLPRHLRGADNNLTIKQLNNSFYFKSYPKTKALVYKYTGPYEYLILVYQKLFGYIQNQKIKLKGQVFETYKYGPLNTKSKYDYQTIIGFPI